MPAVNDRLDEPAVRDRVLPLRHRNPDAVLRLVGQQVVARKPARGALWLRGDECAVVSRDPAVRRAIRVDLRPRVASVAHADAEVASPPQPMARADLELLATARVTGSLAVHRQALDAEVPEVEVEARERLLRAGVDDRSGGEMVGGGLVPEAEVVARDLVAAVARLREVRIAAPWRPLDEARIRGGRDERTEHYNREGRERRANPADVHQEPSSAISPPRTPSSSATVLVSSSASGPGRSSQNRRASVP